MYVAVDHFLRVLKHRSGVICQNDLALSTGLFDRILIVPYVIHPGEGVAYVSEQLAESL